MIAGVSALIFPHPALNYDTAYALVWGGDLIQGSLPDYTGLGGPTPHPLLTVVAGAAAALGRDAAYDILAVLGYLAWGALLVSVFRLGRVAGSKWLGLAACLVLATSWGIVINAVTASKDIAFAALVTGAVVLEGQRPRRGVWVFVILAVAGLIRPDAWLFSGAYWLYVSRNEPWSRRIITAAAAASAPLAWVLTDLVVTGNPLFSLTRTQDLTIVLDRATGITEVPALLVQGLRDLVGIPAMLGGLAGLILSVARQRSELLPAAALAALVVVFYGVQGAARLPLTGRLLITLAVVVGVFFGFALIGWVRETNPVLRRWWSAAAVLLTLASLGALPSRLETLDEARNDFQVQARAYGDLRALLGQPSVTAAMGRCASVVWHLYPSGETQVPYLAHLLDRKADSLIIFDRPPPARGGLVLPVGSGVVGEKLLPTNDLTRSYNPRSDGYRLVARGSTWAAFERSC